MAISVSLSSITISPAPFFAAALTFNPAIGFTSVMFVPMASITSASAISDRDASNLLLPITCLMADMAFIYPYLAALSILFVPTASLMNFWNKYISSFVQWPVIIPAMASGPSLSFIFLNLSAIISAASSHVTGSSLSTFFINGDVSLFLLFIKLYPNLPLMQRLPSLTPFSKSVTTRSTSPFLVSNANWHPQPQ